MKRFGFLALLCAVGCGGGGQSGPSASVYAGVYAEGTTGFGMDISAGGAFSYDPPIPPENDLYTGTVNSNGGITGHAAIQGRGTLAFTGLISIVSATEVTMDLTVPLRPGESPLTVHGDFFRIK